MFGTDIIPSSDSEWDDAPTAENAGSGVPRMAPPPPPPRRVGSKAGAPVVPAAPSRPDHIATAEEQTHTHTPAVDAPAADVPAVDAPVPTRPGDITIPAVSAPAPEILEAERAARRQTALSTDVDTPPVGKKKEPKIRTGKSRVAKEASGAITMPGGLRLTERDHHLLTFLARYKIATISQLARHFDTSETALRNRLPRLEKAGLLGWAYTGQTKPKVWTVTDTGLKVCGTQLTAPQISWATLRHTLGLVDLGITFEQAGELVVTEREIRAAAMRDTPTTRMRTAIDIRRTLNTDPGADSANTAQTGYIVPMPGRTWGHIPDMVLVRQPFDNGAPGSIAIELELTRKNLSDWRNILTAYRDGGQFAQVVYYVTDADVEKALTNIVRQLSATHQIQIVRFAPIETAADA